MEKHRVVCAMCGLVACVCLVASEVVESRHPSQDKGGAPIVAVMPTAPHGDHTHEERTGAVLIADLRSVAVSGTSASDVPPPSTFSLDTAYQVARRAWSRQWHPGYYATSFSFVPPPDLFTSPSPAPAVPKS